MAAKKKGKQPEEEIPKDEDVKTEEQVQETPESEAEPSAEDKLEAELAAEKEKYLRLAAEYDNYRKRSAKERESVFTDAREDTVKRFLPVYDNLERALKQETQDEAYCKGVEMIMTQYREVLEKIGVSEIAAVGETFDPELHNAVMHMDDEEKGENEIVEEFQKGFKLGDKVIRFAMVKVAN